MGETGETVGAAFVDLVEVVGSSSALDVASKRSLDKKELASNEKLSFKTRPVELSCEEVNCSKVKS